MVPVKEDQEKRMSRTKPVDTCFLRDTKLNPGQVLTQAVPEVHMRQVASVMRSIAEPGFPVPLPATRHDLRPRLRADFPVEFAERAKFIRGPLGETLMLGPEVFQ